MPLKSLQHLGVICLCPVESPGFPSHHGAGPLQSVGAEARDVGYHPVAVCIAVRIALRLMCTQYTCTVSTVRYLLVI